MAFFLSGGYSSKISFCFLASNIKEITVHPATSNLFFIDNGHTNNLTYQSKNIMNKPTYS